jgi:hypothetical protein
VVEIGSPSSSQQIAKSCSFGASPSGEHRYSLSKQIYVILARPSAEQLAHHVGYVLWLRLMRGVVTMFLGCIFDGSGDGAVFWWHAFQHKNGKVVTTPSRRKSIKETGYEEWAMCGDENLWILVTEGPRTLRKGCNEATDRPGRQAKLWLLEAEDSKLSRRAEDSGEPDQVQGPV